MRLPNNEFYIQKYNSSEMIFIFHLFEKELLNQDQFFIKIINLFLNDQPKAGI